MSQLTIHEFFDRLENHAACRKPKHACDCWRFATKNAQWLRRLAAREMEAGEFRRVTSRYLDLLDDPVFWVLEDQDWRALVDPELFDGELLL